MKKFGLSILITSVLVTSACSTNIDSLPLDVSLQNSEVSALSTTKIKFSMDKSEPSLTKKTSSSKLKNKLPGNTKKEAILPNITFTAPKTKNTFGEQSVTDLISQTLFAMNLAKSDEIGSKIGMEALEKLKVKDIYYSKLTYAAASAATDWKDSYRIIAVGFSKILEQVPTTQENACGIAINLMNVCIGPESAAKAGFSLLEVISTTDNVNLKNFILSTYAKAQGASTYEHSYKQILSDLAQLRDQKIKI